MVASRPAPMLAPPRPRGGAPRAFINAYFARDALARGRKKKLPVASASTRSTRIDRASPRVARAPPPETDLLGVPEGAGHITRADIAAACLALNLPGHDAAYVDELVAQFGGDASSGFVAVDSFRAAARRSERSYRAAWDDIATKAGAVTPGGVASPSPSPPSHPPRTMTSAEALTAVRAVGVDTATAEDAEAMIRLLTRGGDDGSSKAACVSISYQNFRRYAALLPRTQLRSKNASWCWLVSATPMKAHERPRAQPRLQLLAGGFAGACAKTLVAPLDRARTIIQDTGWCGQRGSRKTVMGVCAKVFRGEGVAGLFRGNAVSVMKVLPCNALQFAIFNGLKEQLTRAKKQQNNNTNNASSKGVTSTAGDKYSLTLAERLASGGVAGAVSTAACYPLDALKSQMAVSGGLRGGVVAAAKQLYLEQGGIRAFYKGLGPTLVADVVGTALGFTLYDTLTAAYRERCVGGRKATPFEKGVLGGVGACCSMTVTMPLEVVMTRMRVQGIGGRPVLYGSALECLRSIARKEGISSLWLGTTAAYVKIFPQLAATYFLFELASERMGVGGIGSYDGGGEGKKSNGGGGGGGPEAAAAA